MKQIKVPAPSDSRDSWRVLERKIVLRNFAVMAFIGVHDFEKLARQRVTITIELVVEACGRVGRDEITSVLDYDFLRRAVAELVETRHFALQETLCECILDLCFTPAEVLSARVATRKPDVYPDCESVGVELYATRNAIQPGTP